VEEVKRVCLMTGASGSLATAFIQRYADRYRIIAVHNRHPVQFAAQDQEFVDPLAPSHRVAANEHAVHSVRADLSEADGVARLVSEVVAQFGSIDLLINAATMRSWSPLLEPGALDAAEAVLRTNVLAPLRLSVTIAQHLWQSDPAGNQRANRNIINISSSAGLFVYPDQGQTLYSISKAAVNQLTYHLANEFWNIGVRVNALAPDSFPGRVAITEVLEAIIDLDASEQTGQVIPLLSASEFEQEYGSSARS